MEKKQLIKWLELLIAKYDASIPTEAGSPAYEGIIAPLVAKFGDDPYTPDVARFVSGVLQAEFPNYDTSELSAYSDLIGTPAKMFMEPLRRELLRLKMAQNPAFKDYLTEDELAGIYSITGIPRKVGTKSRLTVRMYFRTPRSTSISYGATAFTADGKVFTPTEHRNVTLDEMAVNSEGGNYYVDATFEAAGFDDFYAVGPGAIVGVNGVPGAISAANMSAATPGERGESIEEHIANITTWLSEHAPVTERGVAATVTDAFQNALDVYVRGNGDEEMLRDNLRFSVDAGQATVPIASGVAAAEPLDYVASEAIPLVGRLAGDFTAGIAAAAVQGRRVSRVVVNGREYPVASLSPSELALGAFDTERCGRGENGFFARVTSPCGITVNPRTLLCDSVNPTKLSSARIGDALYLVRGGTLYNYVVLGAGVSDGVPGVQIAGPVSVVKQGVRVALEPQYVLYLPAEPGEYYALEAISGGVSIDSLAGSSILPGQRVALLYGTGGSALTEFSIAEVDGGRLTLVYATGDTPPEYSEEEPSTPVEGFVVYERPDSYSSSLVEAHSMSWYLCAIQDTPPLAMPDNEQAEVTWQLRGAAVGADVQVTVSTPDGATVEALGDSTVHLGGCTDVFVRLGEESSFVDRQPVRSRAPLMSFLASWSAGSDAITGMADVRINRALWDTVFPYSMAEDEPAMPSNLVLCATLESGTVVTRRLLAGSGGARVDTPFDSAAVEAPCDIVLGVDEALTDAGAVLLSSTDGVAAQVGFSTAVSFSARLPALVVPGCTFNVLSGAGEGAYDVASVASDRLRLNLASGQSVPVFSSNVPYTIRAASQSPVSTPVVSVDYVELLHNGSPTGVKLHRREPLACRVTSRSQPVGPRVLLPPNGSSNLPLCAVDFVTELSSVASRLVLLGAIAWSGDARHFGISAGATLILHGALNNMSGTIDVLEYDEDDDVSYALFTEIGHLIYAEENVPFEVHSPQVAGVRAYFERPTHIDLGQYSPGYGAFLTHAGRRYSVDDAVLAEVPVGTYDTRFTIDTSDGPTRIVNSSLDVGQLGVRPGDVLNLLYATVVGNPVEVTLPVAGMSLTLSIGSVTSMLVFSGSAPISLLGSEGIADRISRHFGITATADAVTVGGETRYRLHLASQRPLVVAGGSALDLLGLVAGVSNDTLPESIKGTHLIVYLPTEGGLMLGTEFLAPGYATPAGIVGSISRRGSVLMTAKQMESNIEHGAYYCDMVVRSMDDSVGSVLQEDDLLELDSPCMPCGFSLSTDGGLSYSVREQPTVHLSSLAVGVDGASNVITANSPYRVYYTCSPAITGLQAYLSSDNARATDNSMLARAKPIMRVGVGPLTYPGGATDEVKRLAASRLEALARECAMRGEPLTLQAVLGSLTPMGYRYSIDATLVWVYDDLLRRRRMGFGGSVSLSRLWTIRADPGMIG